MIEFIRIIIYISIYVGLIATTFYILTFWAERKSKKLFFSDDELPKVSVIIPAYNEEKSIVGTIKSILKSDYPKNKFEVIVIDDGSRDRTFKLAKKLESNLVKVFTKLNGGKASALNFGLKKIKGEIVFTMDADTFAEPQSLKNMVRYFKNKEIMSVSPAISIYQPKSILERVQHIEYVTGLFARKALTGVNAVFITPGAFSAYRKSFFEKHGNFDEKNITEDLEMALRIQYNGYKIQNSPESPVYTMAPNNFIALSKQRRRWYYGLIKNTLNYRKLFSRKYGDLGMFAMPVVWLGILLSVFITTYIFFRTIFNVFDEITLLYSVGFDLPNFFSFNYLFFERFFFLFFTNPTVTFVLFFMALIAFYLYYAKRKIKGVNNLLINLPLFFLYFSILFGFWWIISIFYFIFKKGVAWK